MEGVGGMTRPSSVVVKLINRCTCYMFAIIQINESALATMEYLKDIKT